MGIIVDVGHLPAVVWATKAAERWARAPHAAPRQISLPTAAQARVLAPTRPAGQPSRMVAMAGVLATWRAAERAASSMGTDDPGRIEAESVVDSARVAYHQLFDQHFADDRR